MTETALRLRRLGQPHARARALAVLLGSAGAAFAAAALGLALAPRLPGVALAWGCIAASALAAAWAVRRARHEAAAATVGRLVERAAQTRAGSIVGVVSPPPAQARGTSLDLLQAADARAARVVERTAPVVDGLLSRTTRRRVALGAAAALAGATLFVAAAPTSGRAAAFWNPVRAWRDARAP